ncbi:hypothetical protein Mal15_38400 [Stieleria maiorica]|uniref:Uncharacterized protein n=1 Tax=Stieleria maiorica TaxID=2795974 RepID=A0A5B9MG01_9BACT|nr:hypothetical protein [Stieleria maiorica]QEF99773.1 hypothetical protein Mal15_38400 [Stieleria maiorica]
MSDFLTQQQVDVTFNAWWTEYGRTPQNINRALQKTITQINGEPVRRPSGPFPPGYIPPPMRKKSKTNTASKPPSENDPNHLKRLAQQNAAAGRAAAKKELRKTEMEASRLQKRYAEMKRILKERNLTIPGHVADALLFMPCYRNPADRQRHEDRILKRYKNDIDNANRSSHQWRYQQETERLHRERRRKMLAEIEWMSKNTIGAGIYGLQREAGRSHDDAMARAKETQQIFDMAGSGVADPAAARESNSTRHNTRSHRSDKQMVGPNR